MEQVEEERRLKEEKDHQDLLETILLDDDYFLSRDLQNKGKDVHPMAKQRKRVQEEIAKIRFASSAARRKSGVPVSDDMDDEVDLSLKPRILVASGPITRYEPDKMLRRTQRRHMIVFNDIILVTLKKESDDTYEVQEVVWVKDARLKYSKSSTEEEKFSFQLIVNKGRNRPRLSLFFTCESDASWRQWVDDLENTLIAYHRQTEYSKVLGWFHDIIQGNGFSAAYLGDIAELRRHIRAAVDSPLGAPGSKAETMLLNILDQPDRTGMTALHWAALRGHEVCVRMLLDRGAEVDVLQKGMNSPFLLAAAGGHETVARLLLERGAELSLQNHKGHDAVFMAVLFGHASKGLPWLLQLLTHRGIDLNQVDSAGATPLHLCAEKNLARPIRMLVDAGADVNAKYGQNQMSPLQLACKQRIPDVETIRSFLDKGAYPNWRDLSGRTAFEIALSMQPQATSRRQSFGSPTKSNSARFTVDAADNVPPSPHQSQSNDSVTAPAATDRWRSMEETLSQVGDWAVRALPALLELCKKGARFELKDIEFLRQSFRAAVLEARDVWASKAPPTNFREFVTAREQAGEKLLLHKGVWHKDKASATCPLCSDGFGLTNRRHHCRACGVLCCDRCSSKRMMLCGLGERSESSNDLMPASPSAANSNNAFKEERVCDGCFNRLSHEASLPSPDNFRVRQLKQCALDAIQSIEELIESLDDPYGDPNNFQASLRETQQLTRDLSKVSFSTGTTAVASASRSMYGSMSSVTSVRGARLQAQFGSDGASNTSLPRASGEALVEALKIRDSRLYRAEDVVAKFLEAADGYHRVSRRLIEQKQESSRLWGSGPTNI